MPVRGTPNYVWFTEQPLGSGATGEVFVGRHKPVHINDEVATDRFLTCKRLGTFCAVKVFVERVQPAHLEMRHRELALMSRLEHPNIVKFLAIEDETRTREKVLVMELCTEGSVHDLLTKPDYAHGLPEAEYFCFVIDLAAGMEYLNKQGIVHRDIKPGNILCTKEDDGRFVYKLTDFGSSRELDPGENFPSVYGTEEYLHPDVYGVALLGKMGTRFTAVVDLWSAGATMYHVSCGRVPFVAARGREDKQIIHKIISEKKPGSITGIQKTQGGIIEYSAELPNTCLLSNGLKLHVVPMIAGLLETNAKHQWPFEKFFDQVKKLKETSPVHVYCVASVRPYLVYLDSSAALADFMVILRRQRTERAEQLEELFYRGRRLPDVVSETDRIVSCLRTSDDNPIVLWSRPEVIRLFVQFPDKPTLIVENSTLETDAVWSRDVCALIIYIRKVQRVVQQAQTFLLVCRECLCSEIENRFKSLTSSFSKAQEAFKAARKALEMSGAREKMSAAAQRALKDTNLKLPSLERLERHVTGNIRIFPQDKLIFIGPKTTECDAEKCMAKMQSYEEGSRKTNEKFHKDRKQSLSYNEEQIHKYDRIKQDETMNKTIRLFNEHCLKATERAFQAMLDWCHSDYKKFLEGLVHLENDSGKFREGVTEISTTITMKLEVTSVVRRDVAGAKSAESAESSSTISVPDSASTVSVRDSYTASRTSSDSFKKVELAHRILQGGLDMVAEIEEGTLKIEKQLKLVGIHANAELRSDDVQ